MAVIPKKIFVKVYGSAYPAASSFIDTLDPIESNGFEEKINVGYGPASFTFPAKLGNYGEGKAIWYGNVVQLIVVDVDSGSDGSVQYTGYIADYKENAQGNTETVVVDLISFATQFSNTPAVISGNTLIKTASTTTGQALITTTQEAENREVSDVIKKTIDLMRANNGAPQINYTSSSVAVTGVGMTYKWAGQTCKQLLDDAVSFVGAAYYWRIDPKNVFYFQPKPSVVTWQLELGSDFTRYNVEKSTNDIVNRIIFDNGDAAPSICKEYVNTPSRTKYGDRFQYVSDNRVTDITTADTKMNAIIAANAEPSLRITLTVLDNNYVDNGMGIDLETMQVGDTVNIRGLDELNARSIRDNLQIVSIKKRLDEADIELEKVSYSPNYLAVSTAKKVDDLGGDGANTVLGTTTPPGDTGDVKMSYRTVDHQDPDGRWWLKLDGQPRSRVRYAALFQFFQYGILYGTGDGSTTFNVPNYRDRMPIGAGTLFNVNDTGGSMTYDLSHVHGYGVGIIQGGSSSGSNEIWVDLDNHIIKSVNSTGTDFTMQRTGQVTAGALSTTQNLMPPYFATSYFVKS